MTDRQMVARVGTLLALVYGWAFVGWAVTKYVRERRRA